MDASKKGKVLPLTGIEPRCSSKNADNKVQTNTQVKVDRGLRHYFAPIKLAAVVVCGT